MLELTFSTCINVQFLFYIFPLSSVFFNKTFFFHLNFRIIKLKFKLEPEPGQRDGSALQSRTPAPKPCLYTLLYMIPCYLIRQITGMSCTTGHSWKEVLLGVFYIATTPFIRELFWLQDIRFNFLLIHVPVHIFVIECNPSSQHINTRKILPIFAQN